MGASAAQSLTGSGKAILSRRGNLEQTQTGLPVLLTLHPSAILRQTDPAAKATLSAHLLNDLKKAKRIIG